MGNLIDRQDQQVLDLLIKKILADGHHIGVSDGEETVLDNSCKYSEVVAIVVSINQHVITLVAGKRLN